MKLFERIFGSYSDKELKRINPIVDKIEAMEPEMQKLSDSQLKAKTNEFKERLTKGETLDDTARSLCSCKGSLGQSFRASSFQSSAYRRNYIAPGAYRRDEDR